MVTAHDTEPRPQLSRQQSTMARSTSGRQALMFFGDLAHQRQADDAWRHGPKAASSRPRGPRSTDTLGNRYVPSGRCSLRTFRLSPKFVRVSPPVDLDLGVTLARGKHPRRLRRPWRPALRVRVLRACARCGRPVGTTSVDCQITDPGPTTCSRSPTTTGAVVIETDGSVAVEDP